MASVVRVAAAQLAAGQDVAADLAACLRVIDATDDADLHVPVRAAENKSWVVADIDPARARAAIAEVAGAFLDIHLRGAPGGALEKATQTLQIRRR